MPDRSRTLTPAEIRALTDEQFEVYEREVEARGTYRFDPTGLLRVGYQESGDPAEIRRQRRNMTTDREAS